MWGGVQRHGVQGGRDFPVTSRSAGGLPEGRGDRTLPQDVPRTLRSRRTTGTPVTGQTRGTIPAEGTKDVGTDETTVPSVRKPTGCVPRKRQSQTSQSSVPRQSADASAEGLGAGREGGGTEYGDWGRTDDADSSSLGRPLHPYWYKCCGPEGHR